MDVSPASIALRSDSPFLSLFDSICYMSEAQIISRMREGARTADELHERSRRLLIESVRSGAAAGLSQRQISEAVGRSQPEVSRLLRFHGSTTHGRALESNRRPLLKLLSSAGGRNVRVFGSVRRGEDTSGSDVDLLVDFVEPIGLFRLARLEAAAAEILGVAVEVVPSSSLRENVAAKILDEAIPL